MSTEAFDTQDQDVDLNTNESSLRTGEISEGELDFIKQIAKQAGWVEQDESERTIKNYLGASEYLKKTAEENKNLKTKLKEVDKAAKLASEKWVQLVKAESLKKIEQATLAGNVEEAVKAANELAQTNVSPDRTVEDWANKHSSWFGKDPMATALAKFVSEEVFRNNGSTEEQLERAEAVVKERFPEYFPETKKPKKAEVVEEDDEEDEKPLTRRAPSVQPGTRSTSISPREKVKGWSDLPKEVRSAMTASVNAMVTTFKTDPEKARAELAKTYWEEN